jgi:hypothetical protein
VTEIGGLEHLALTASLTGALQIIQADHIRV